MKSSTKMSPLLAATADAARTIRLFPRRSLARLVEAHRPDLDALGLASDGLARADDDDVLAWLHARAGLLPAALADDLERIGELTDDRGAQALLLAAGDQGLDARRLGGDPLEVAVAAFLDHREVFERALGRRAASRMRGTVEFVGRSAVPATFRATDLPTLEAELGAQFEERARSAHCRVTAGRDGPRVVFTIARGGLVRCDEALEDDQRLLTEPGGPTYLAERAVRYRPQRRDLVVYDTATGTLRVQAPDAPTVQSYRRAFGRLLHGNADWFGDGPVVSLEPLVTRGVAIEAPTPGLKKVRVVGIVVRYDAADGGTLALEADEIWPFLAARLHGGLEEGEVVEATFRVWRMTNPRPALVRVRAPNRIEYGRVAEDLFRPWLEARGFLARDTVRLAG